MKKAKSTAEQLLKMLDSYDRELAHYENLADGTALAVSENTEVDAFERAVEAARFDGQRQAFREARELLREVAGRCGAWGNDATNSCSDPATASEELGRIFAEVDERIEASGLPTPSIEEIVAYCERFREERARAAGEIANTARKRADAWFSESEVMAAFGITEAGLAEISEEGIEFE